MTDDRISSDDIHNPHDRGYKYLLSSENVFLELLESFVDKGWVEKLDESCITRIDKSYILQDFNEKEADLVYRLKVKGQEVIFYILVEMQSTVDYQMSYRLLLYMVEVWRDILKNTGVEEARKKEFRLPAIVPMVLYNGAGNWIAGRSFKEMLGGYEMFIEHVVDFKYILIDINRYGKEMLMELSNLIGSVFLLDQEIDREEFLRRLAEMAGILKKFNFEDYRLFKAWLKNIAMIGLPDKMKIEVTKIIEESNPMEVDNMVYNLERTFRNMQLEDKEEGKKEGKKEGRLEAARNMLAEGMDIPLIMKVTRLPEKEILRLKEEMG